MAKKYKKWTVESLIKEFIKIHGNKYDYSEFKEFKNVHDKIVVRCIKHDLKFYPSSHNHKSGTECIKCGNESKGAKAKLKIEEVIKQFKSVHGNNYDYSLFNTYHGTDETIKIRCIKHNLIFKITCIAHKKGGKCPKCARECTINSILISKDTWIRRFQEKHGVDRYEYKFLNKDIRSSNYIEIRCLIHDHIFKTTINHHSRGSGCPICKESRGEKSIRLFLIKNGIKFEFQKRFMGCKNKRHLAFDFYLPDYNCCIEFDGEQHSRLIKGFNNKRFSEQEAKQLLYNNQTNDKIKNKFCEENDINLIRIEYRQMNNFTVFLMDKLNSIKII